MAVLSYIHQLFNVDQCQASIHTPTVCPSNDAANMLSYQELPNSIQLW
jgi:hypothetical protein